MSSVSKNGGLINATGAETGEASAITVKLTFKPSLIRVVNRTTKKEYLWTPDMGQDKAWESSQTGGGTAVAQTWTQAAITSTSGCLGLASPAFSGTGFATSSQVITTTDNQTMTLNQCAGMWFIADALTSTAPVLIVSNTAVTAAPAVLTVIGTAPATNAGTYKIARVIVSGTNATSAVTATAANAQALSSNAITAGSAGFILGTSVQTTSDDLVWEAFR